VGSFTGEQKDIQAKGRHHRDHFSGER
jgi:hypothetical protein